MLLNDLEQQRQRFHPELQEALAKLKGIDDLAERARLRGQISGIHRRYRAELLVAATTWAIGCTPGAEPTKFLVAHWQQQTFGRSLHNGVLAKLWCDSRRGAGERGALPIAEHVTAQAAEAYALYAQALDAEPDRGQLDLLAAALLEADLGL